MAPRTPPSQEMGLVVPRVSWGQPGAQIHAWHCHLSEELLLAKGGADPWCPQSTELRPGRGGLADSCVHKPGPPTDEWTPLSPGHPAPLTWRSAGDSRPRGRASHPPKGVSLQHHPTPTRLALHASRPRAGAPDLGTQSHLVSTSLSLRSSRLCAAHENTAMSPFQGTEGKRIICL